jgi:hypothetical protein
MTDTVEDLELEIIRLRAELAAERERTTKLREAMEPFAKFKDHWPIVPTHEEYERARAVLAETGGGHE